MLARIWNEWVDPETGELVPSYSMLKINCDDHPLLRRLHKPAPKLPGDAHDKRAVVHVEPGDWEVCLLGGSKQAARAVLRTQAPAFYSQDDAEGTDSLLANLF